MQMGKVGPGRGRKKLETPWQRERRRAVQAAAIAANSAADWDAVADASFRRKFEAGLRELEEFRTIAMRWQADRVESKVERPGRAYELWVRSTAPLPREAEDALGHSIEDARSCLDQLAYAIAGLNGPLTNREKAEVLFPIRTKQPDTRDARARRGLATLSKEAREVVEGLQPYAAFPPSPTDSPLFWLDDLAQKSKHRSNIVLTAATASRIQVGNGWIDKMAIDSANLSKVGEWQRVAHVSRGTRANMQILTRHQLQFDVSDSILHERDVVVTMDAIYAYLRNTVFPPLLGLAV